LGIETIAREWSPEEICALSPQLVGEVMHERLPVYCKAVESTMASLTANWVYVRDMFCGLIIRSVCPWELQFLKNSRAENAAAGQYSLEVVQCS
jgi:hypothetical protein